MATSKGATRSGLQRTKYVYNHSVRGLSVVTRRRMPSPLSGIDTETRLVFLTVLCIILLTVIRHVFDQFVQEP